MISRRRASDRANGAEREERCERDTTMKHNTLGSIIVFRRAAFRPTVYLIYFIYFFSFFSFLHLFRSATAAAQSEPIRTGNRRTFIIDNNWFYENIVLHRNSPLEMPLFLMHCRKKLLLKGIYVSWRKFLRSFPIGGEARAQSACKCGAVKQ